MSEAKPQDGTTVKGYRVLSASDLNDMNALKDISRAFCEYLDDLKQRGADPRWLAMAKTSMQQSCMFACRAVAQPDDDC